VFKPLGHLTRVRTIEHGVVLTSPNGLIEVSALDRDVFRLRATPTKRFSNKPSYAVVQSEWTGGDVRVVAHKKSITLKSDVSRLSVRLADGRFQLSGDSGVAITSRSIGFEGRSPRLELQLTEDEHLFGLGETTGTFNKRGLIREFWNTDILGHAPAIHPGMRSLYVSIPFAVTMRDGVAAGLFWDNPARQRWDMGSTEFDAWKLGAESGELDLYLFLGPTVENVVNSFGRLTGRMPMPPKWALGFHQCRYSYESGREVEDVARTMRRRRIPCDAVYLDIHHMHGYRVFTFGRTFPRPKEMVERLARKGFKVVSIVDPGVKHDPKFGVLKRGRQLDAFVKDPTGRKDFIGRVWPGASRYPDFMNESVRHWWAKEQGALSRRGIAGFWNDMNEPANFARPDKTLDPRARHRTDHGPVRHAEVHNLYGSMMARASREGALRANPDVRPFIITRAGYAGVQREAMVWTGDNSSTWQHFEDSLQVLLNLGVSGVPFCGCDAGGFLDNCTPELFVRWMQCAAFTPFFRSHTNIGTIRQEPWSFGPEAETVVRHYIELRYQLLPYLYSLFAQAARDGSPIMRPLFWHHGDDLNAVDTGDQFLLGRDVMVAPVLKQGAAVRSVYLPEGRWHDFWTGALWEGRQYILSQAPLQILPLFIRGGAVIPFGLAQQFTGERSVSELALHHWADGMGTLELYDDDGSSQEYQDGAFMRRSVFASSSLDAGKLSVSKQTGNFDSPVCRWRVVLHALARKPRVTCNGRLTRCTEDPETGGWCCELAAGRDGFELHWEGAS
jgi:alpha-glucosidase